MDIPETGPYIGSEDKQIKAILRCSVHQKSECLSKSLLLPVVVL